MNLQKFVEENPSLVTRKESRNYPGLFVIKYTRKIFFDNLWTPELEICRGLVVDVDWNVVIRPFTKIYNRGERRTDFDRDEIVCAVEKKNGFMCAVTYVESLGKCVVSTTGSLDSDYVVLATPYVEPFFKYIEAYECNTTWLFEICSPKDPHIIAEEEGAYLIGAQDVGYENSRHEEHNLDFYAVDMGAKRPAHKYIRFGDLVTSMKDCKHEGYVVHLGAVASLKIKSPYYLVTKALARGNFEKILVGAKQRIDEEYYPLLDYLKTIPNFTSLEEQAKITIIRGFLEINLYHYAKI
jgi:hypothetical protein